METQQIAQLLNDTFSTDGHVVRIATDSLDRLSLLPHFPFSLLSIVTGGENQGQKVAAATYLKNFIRRSIDANGPVSKVSKEFRDTLMRALLQVEHAVLKVLVEAFRVIVAAEFVKENSWPELVPELRSVIQESDLVKRTENCEWKTINALTVLHSLIRPFQYFLNPKVAKEPVPPQLELIAQEIIAPLLAVFHQCVEKVLSIQGRAEVETEKFILIVCKCLYFAVRSHMPSALAPLLPSLCRDLFAILHSLSFVGGEALEDGYMLRLKTGKRSLLIFSALVTRHRKFSDKLMPDIINCVSKIVKHSPNISKLDFLSERIVSLSFDVISRVLETGPGWRLVSPHFSSLLDCAIFPALVLNEKDVTEWEEDADEYIRKNLPSDLDEISGWREDLFTPRKSALNLLGVISMSKGPPVASSVSSKRKKGERNKQKNRSSMGELLVLPFLSKFPIPTDVKPSVTRIINDYYGVLMAYGSLLDFLRDQRPGFTATLIRTRLLPLYRASVCQPYLVASANWVLGELASCIPEEMNADVYPSLLKALTMPDMGDSSCYPVRVSAAGAIAELVENDYLPPEWLPLLQVVVGTIGDKDEETAIMFQLLGTLVEAGNENVAPHIPDIISLLVGAISKSIPPHPEPWPQMVERGFAALSVMAQCWEGSVPEEAEQNESSEMWVSGRATIARAFSDLLQKAWLNPTLPMEGEIALPLPPLSCIDDSSTLLRFIMQDVTESDVVLKFKVSELLLVWADLISDWHAWEEMEDLSIFSCIKEVVNLQSKFALKNFIAGDVLPPPAPPVPRHSIIEGIGAFVSEALSQYPSATCRASSCVHMLLHVSTFSFEAEGVKQALVMAFSQTAFSHFREIRSTPSPLWKPLLLAISSCYLCFPDIVERILEKDENEGFTVWASALAFICTSKFEHGLSTVSEIKLTVMVLARVVERSLKLGNQGNGLLRDCFAALIEASVRLKELDEEEEEENEDEDAGNEDTEEEDDDDDEDSEDDEREETEEEFLERCAQAAVSLENRTVVEEADTEDQEQEIELGGLEEVDQQSIVLSLIESYHQVLIQGQSLPPQLISGFLNAFPECSLYFQQPLQ